ncbi:type II secretion system protein N [Hyphococcus lacteus]|uniref:Type II secretion system protein N n=1 Tax=Hyphococcus lacteus TaxID=3143536 RepID=A0ABV3Z6W4_9PROT
MKARKISKSPRRLMMSVFAIVFFVSMAALLPASVVALFINFDSQNISYSGTKGTVWAGTLEGLNTSGASLGDVSYKLSPLSILGLSPKFDITARNGTIVGEGKVAFSISQTITVTDLIADFDLGALAPQGVLGAPTQGIARIEATKISLAPKRGCIAANGTIWTNVLNAPARRYNMPALPMSGDVKCDGEILVVTLMGENPRAGANMELRVDRSLSYELSATASSSENDINTALRVLGFEDANGELVYGSAGIFRSAGS